MYWLTESLIETDLLLVLLRSSGPILHSDNEDLVRIRWPDHTNFNQSWYDGKYMISYLITVSFLSMVSVTVTLQFPNFLTSQLMPTQQKDKK